MDWEVDMLYLMECYELMILGEKISAAISVKCQSGHTCCPYVWL